MHSEVIKLEDVSKTYRLGEFGFNSLQQDMLVKANRMLGRFTSYSTNRQPSTSAKPQEIHALSDINLEIRRGEITAIVGNNGSGKSTLLKLISGITVPTSGLVKTNGRIASLLEVGTGFHPELTGRENIYLNGSILGMSRSEINLRLNEIVDFSGCSQFIDTPIKRYSSGMVVRLGFAVAAYLESDTLIVDEVLAVGDQEFRQKAVARINELSKQKGTTVLFVSHNLSVVRSLCKSAILLSGGKLLDQGPLSTVLNNYSKQYSSVATVVDFKIDGEFGISKIVLDPDQLNKGNFKLTIDYRAGLGCEPRPGFVIYNDEFQPLFSSNTTMHPPAEDLKEEGTAVCFIENMPLHEGNYFLSVWLGSDEGRSVEKMFCLKFAFSPKRIIVHKPDLTAIGYLNIEGNWIQSME